MSDEEQGQEIMVCKGMIKIGSANEYKHLYTVGQALKERQSITHLSR
jgi:hypothetical protein